MSLLTFEQHGKGKIQKRPQPGQSQRAAFWIFLKGPRPIGSALTWFLLAPLTIFSSLPAAVGS